MTAEEQYFTINETAEVLGLPLTTLRNWADPSKTFPTKPRYLQKKKIDGRVMFSKSTLLRWLAANEDLHDQLRGFLQRTEPTGLLSLLFVKPHR